jgi:hypothetical protein
VDARAATTRDEQQKRMIDAFIEQSVGFEGVNERITNKAMEAGAAAAMKAGC